MRQCDYDSVRYYSLAAIGSFLVIPKTKNYSPFKYVTLIFKLLLFVSLRVKIATIGVLKVSLGKLTPHVRYLIGDRFCFISHSFSSGG